MKKTTTDHPTTDHRWILYGFARAAALVAAAGLVAMASGQDRNSIQSTLRGGPGGGLTPGFELPEWPGPPNPLDAITPVSDRMLADPPDGEWLTWRRTHDAQGYSALDQIHRDNVDELRVAWSLTLPPGQNESTPLVHDGVIFVQSYGDNVMALDAATGDELWHYTRDLEGNAGPKKNMALYSDKLYFGTSDAHLVALDVRTGFPVFDVPLVEAGQGFNLTGGPLVANGKVMQGLNGGGGGGAYIAAVDSETGAEAWRFYSIARPGQPGGNSWNGLPVDERSGGSVWTAGSYDPELNLAYFGPAPTYNTGPLREADDDPATSNDALYTNTTVAIDPDTGELVWYYQHMHNDQWDYDWAFERTILPDPAADDDRKVVITGGKPGVFDALDAATGDYLFSVDMGLQNFITAIDPQTGRKTYDPELIPGSTGEQMVVCPHPGGGRSWIPTAFHPGEGLLIIPAVETCMDLTPVEGGRGFMGSGARVSVRPRPDSDGRYGRVQAINLETRETAWTARQHAPQSTGILATAGGLVFAGAMDRYLTAYDVEDGDPLWRVRLNDVPNSAPITYTVAGRQYVAVTMGYGGGQIATFPELVPDIPLPVVRASTIWVFALPE
jgi:alcohol dehydrogenase (cytochrome c)